MYAPPSNPIDLTGLEKPLLLGMYRRMALAREFEEKLYYLFLTRAMPGTMHQATGQEAVAVGVISALRPDDTITSTHRGHAHCIAKDVPVNEMMAEMFAKRTGSCRGLGGSMHLSDFRRGMLGAFAIVGAGIPIAAGAALSAKVQGTGQVSVAFFGDGAVNEGTFHESLNMASLWKLPAIFVIENNQYALSMTNVRSSAETDLYRRGQAYRIPGIRADGNDVTAVYRAAREAAQHARDGEGPTLLEFITYRIRGHARFEQSAYREKEEVESWKQADPILRLRQALLLSSTAAETELAEIDLAVSQEVEDAIAFAEASEDAGPEDYLPYVTDEVTHA